MSVRLNSGRDAHLEQAMLHGSTQGSRLHLVLPHPVFQHGSPRACEAPAHLRTLAHRATNFSVGNPPVSWCFFSNSMSCRTAGTRE